jgi:MSHA pilin protein MshC
MVELMVVIVIMGVLGAAAASRFIDRSNMDSRAYADIVAATVRYGQKMAIAQNRDIWVRLNASGIALCYQADCAATARVTAAGGRNSGAGTTIAACGGDTWACEAPPSGVTMSTSSQFYFDAVGKPFAASDVSPTSTSTFTTLTVSVAGGPAARTFAVEAETGYVH